MEQNAKVKAKQEASETCCPPTGVLRLPEPHPTRVFLPWEPVSGVGREKRQAPLAVCGHDAVVPGGAFGLPETGLPMLGTRVCFLDKQNHGRYQALYVRELPERLRSCGSEGFPAWPRRKPWREGEGGVMADGEALRSRRQEKKRD